MVSETTTERRHGGYALLSDHQEPIIFKALNSSITGTSINMPTISSLPRKLQANLGQTRTSARSSTPSTHS